MTKKMILLNASPRKNKNTAQETFQTSDTTINGLDEIQFK